MIHRDVEKTLNLGRVKVHAQYAIGAGRGDDVCHQLGGDWSASLILAILSRIAEIGYHRGDAFRRCATQAVDVDQQFHEVGINRIAG